MEERQSLVDRIREELVGQGDALDAILPYVDIWNAGLHSGDRPIGNFLLLGPSGSGKTKTVEALAYALHGSERNVLRVDCGEFQLDHEVAKLIGCFAPGTQVLMDGGRTVAIQDVKAGDWVVSKTGNLRRVLDTHEYSHDGDMVRLWVSNSDIPLNCTPDHKILAIRVGYTGKRLRNPSLLYDPAKLEWIPARDLRKNDIVVHPRFKGPPCPAGFTIDMAKYAATMPKTHFDDDWVWNGAGPRVKRRIEVNEDFARLAGYYVADGGVVNGRKCIHFTLGLPQKQGCVDDLLQLIPRVFGDECQLHTQDRSKRHSVRLILFSRVVSLMMADLFGDHTIRKQAPDWFVACSDSILCNFLDAAIMCDGCRRVTRRVDYSTTSERLHSQIGTMLRRLGFAPQSQLRTSAVAHWMTGYRTYISGRQIDRFASMMPKGGGGVDVSLPGDRTGTQRMAHVDADYVYSRVVGVEAFQYQGSVYDLSVDEDTSYVANLITVSNSPPGYLGHRETHPLLTQQKLNAVTSQGSDISLVLFDEIEKAALSLTRLLLGVLDKGALKLGDNTTVSFCTSMIFLTSNLGARQMSDMLTERYGFKSEKVVTKAQLMKAGMVAVRKRFSPEFINRLDRVIAYEPLREEEYRKILSIQMEKLQSLVDLRLAEGAYRVCLTEEGKEWVMARGCSKEYGAREMKRVLHREVVAKLARLRPAAGSVVRFGVRDGELVAVEAAA